MIFYDTGILKQKNIALSTYIERKHTLNIHGWFVTVGVLNSYKYEKLLPGQPQS